MTDVKWRLSLMALAAVSNPQSVLNEINVDLCANVLLSSVLFLFPTTQQEKW